MPPSSSASGELWGHHLMPAELSVDCLLPNGILISMACIRDTTLMNLKEDLWREAKKNVLFHRLLAPFNYIFVTVGLGGLEELYDESRRLCDIRLFVPVFKLVEPVGNRAEKQLARDISLAMGRPLTEFDESREVELIQARMEFFRVTENAVEERMKDGIDMYCFPSDVVYDFEPKELENIDFPDEIAVCLWMSSIESNGTGAQKMTVKFSSSLTPQKLISDAIMRRTRKLSSLTLDKKTVCDEVERRADTLILKVAGCQLYLTENKELYRFDYIQKCVQHSVTPQLMVMSKQETLESLNPKWDIIQPSFLRRKMSTLFVNPGLTEKMTLWEVDNMFRVRIDSASYINITDVDLIYVKVAVYHGPDQLAERESSHVSPSNPRWSEVLEFDLYIPDIPHAAQICFALCSVKSRKQRVEHWPLAWANLRLISYEDNFLDQQITLHLWSYPKGFTAFFHPLGHNGSNPSRDTSQLEIQFQPFEHPVVYPPNSQIKDYVTRFVNVWKRKENPEKAPVDPMAIGKADYEMFMCVKGRDPLHELAEVEKETMWKLRLYCKLWPDSLPRLLDSVKWSSREEVAEVYILLEQWETVSPDTALELLDIKYPDQAVRKFAVKCLDNTLSDTQLLLYLMSLVQVLKYEAFIDNDLSKFLLKRALMNQRIGHLFFWLVRAELGHNSSWTWFGLILEAYCRGCGPYLQSLLKQVDMIEKLEILSNLVKDKKEDSFKVLHEELLHSQETFQNLESPLDSSMMLGSLRLDDCRVIDSAKKPIWLAWHNPDPLAELLSNSHEMIFKNGDDLRQDMLTLQVLRIMDSIWKKCGHDFHLVPYRCLPMGKQIGMIEVVKNSATIFEIQKTSKVGGLAANIGKMGSRDLHTWIKEHNRSPEEYKKAVERFTQSCAGYCVATFVLGIRDRHQDNIMLTQDGRLFHIDFGHFLGHYKRKFGINRERVPFVLTDMFITVIAKGAENPKKSDEFESFQKLCGEAYMILHRTSRLFITLFIMMLCMGIPELQKLEDINYLRRTLATDLSEKEALQYFQTQFKEAYQGNWTTKTDWFFHAVKHA